MFRLYSLLPANRAKANGPPRKFALCQFLAGLEKTHNTPCLNAISARTRQTPLSPAPVILSLSHPTPAPPPQSDPTLAPPNAHKLPCRLLRPHQTQPMCELNLCTSAHAIKQNGNQLPGLQNKLHPRLSDWQKATQSSMLRSLKSSITKSFIQCLGTRSRNLDARKIAGA